MNILDTPGHKDFSEDTYRTLVAADSAVMLIDAAKGVEAQTRKLFEVCRMRRIPIFTFVNKMDRLGRDPFDLMSEIEEVLGIDAVPVNWPVGQGSDFLGVYDRLGERLLTVLGRRARHQAGRSGDEVDGEPSTADRCARRWELGRRDRRSARIARWRRRGLRPRRDRHAPGEQTPMFFGSALTNFGVSPFLERFLELAPSAPGARESDAGPDRPGRKRLLGLRVQDPGEHGSRTTAIASPSCASVRGAS